MSLGYSKRLQQAVTVTFHFLAAVSSTFPIKGRYPTIQPTPSKKLSLPMIMSDFIEAAGSNFGTTTTSFCRHSSGWLTRSRANFFVVVLIASCFTLYSSVYMQESVVLQVSTILLQQLGPHF